MWKTVILTHTHCSCFWVTYCVRSVCVCVADSEPTRRVTTCGQRAGLCISAVRRSEETPAPRVPSIRESVLWSRFCCFNALLLVSINIFLYAYFAWGEVRFNIWPQLNCSPSNTSWKVIPLDPRMWRNKQVFAQISLESLRHRLTV